MSKNTQRRKKICKVCKETRLRAGGQPYKIGICYNCITTSSDPECIKIRRKRDRDNYRKRYRNDPNFAQKQRLRSVENNRLNKLKKMQKNNSI